MNTHLTKPLCRIVSRRRINGRWINYVQFIRAAPKRIVARRVPLLEEHEPAALTR